MPPASGATTRDRSATIVGDRTPDALFLRESPTMFLSKPKPNYEPGTRVRIVQYLRVGHRRWMTEVIGTVEAESLRPVGGMEMGGKALYCHQPTLRLRCESGEITEVALDGNTEVHPFDGDAATAAAGHA